MVKYLLVIITVILLYCRIFLEREPYVINALISNWRIIVVTLIILTQSYLLNKTIQELYCLKPSINIIKRVLEYFQEYYNKLLDSATLITFRVKIIIIFIQLYAMILRGAIFNKGCIYLQTMIYIQSPKLVLSLALFLDIFLFNKIFIFYQMFYLGALPIIYNIVLRLVKLYYNNLYENLHKLDIITLPEYHIVFQTLDIIKALELSKQTRLYYWSNILILTIQIISWSYYLILYFTASFITPLNPTLLILILFYIL